MNALRDLVPSAQPTSDAPPGESFLRPSSTLPLEASLKQLLRSEASSDEAFFDYELAQALRGLAHAVKSTQSLPVPSAVPASPAPLISTVTTSSATRPAPSELRITGRELALWRLAHACVTSEAAVNTAIYLSTRLLCDGASAYGEGNDRPSCTREWTSALLTLAAEPVWATAAAESHVSSAAAGQALITQAYVDRRLQLGYCILLAGTLRMVACDHVPGKHLLLDYPALVQGVLERVLPSVALLAGGTDGSDAAALSDSSALPSRLRVEANHCLIHCTYWTAMDTLTSHEAVGRAEDGETPGQTRPTGLRMLDRDVPQVLWPQLGLFRRALTRCLAWCRADALRATTDMMTGHTDRHTSETSPAPTTTTTTTSVATALVDGVFGALLKTHEKLSHARRAAGRQYGESAKDYHLLSDALWSSTLRLCIVLRDVAGAFTGVQAGLALEVTSSNIVLQTNRDVLLHIASCVLRVPALEKPETESEVLSATSALLSASVCVAAAAPVLPLQSSLWGADVAVTREIHAALVQRALHYHDETVLKLASFLSSNLVYALAPSASTVASSIAADSSEQLLDMLADSRDAASQCAIDMLTRAVAERPHSLLPALFRLLHHGSPQARRNTLEVLVGLPRHCAPDSPADALVAVADNRARPTRAAPAAKQRETLRLLAENLLLHLQDEELCLRLQTAALFEKVWPEDVMRPLLTLSITRDATGRKQAAASKALDSVMSAHTQDADVVLLLWQEAMRLMEDSAGTLSVGQPTARPEANRSKSVDPASVTDASTSDAKPPAPPPPPPAQPSYQTPADILSHSLLYSAQPLTAQMTHEAEMEDAELANDASASRSPVSQPASPSASRAARQKLRDRVTALVTRCALVWARHISPVWSASAHVNPLLLFLQTVSSEGDDDDDEEENQTSSTTTAGTVKAPSPSAEREGFVWRCLTGLLAHVSSPSFDGPLGAPAALTASICCVFLDAEAGHTGNDTAPFAPWLVQVASWAALEPADHTANHTADAHHRRTLTNAVLAPLLCLRACHECVMASLTAAALVAGADGTAQDDDHTLPLLRRLWRTLWAALTEPLYRRGFDRLPEAQRVLLDVLTRFPADSFFATVAEAETTSDVGEAPLPTMTPLFTARLFTFGLCSYLSRPAGPAVSTARTHKAELDAIADQLVLPWMLDSTTPHRPSSEADAQLQRLALSVADGYALFAVLELGETQSDRTEEVAKDTKGNCLAVDVLTRAYRADKARDGEERLSAHMAEAASSASAPMWLARFQLWLLVQRRVLELFQRQASPASSATPPSATETGAASVASRYLTWCALYFPCLMELANAAAAASHSASPVVSEAVYADEAEHVTVQCTDLLFFAVMASRGFTTAGAATPSDAAAAPSATQSPLQRLGYSDKAALVQFAIGTTRYHKSPAIQQSGVKLLSALLGVAPEVFTEAAETKAGGDQLALLQDGAQALYSVSLMHPDAPTRRTAEQVLHLLGGATSAAHLQTR